MRFTVTANDSRTVDTENHVQLLQSNIVQKHVICSLQKAGINSKNRQKTLLCHAGCHGNRMTLCNSDVEETVRKMLGKVKQAGAVRHGGSYGSNSSVCRGKHAKFFSHTVTKSLGDG